MKLGVFNFNCSGGMTMVADSPHRVDWATMQKIAIEADELGLDAVVPVARWRGFGGSGNFNGESFESFTWAAGLAEATERTRVFATLHVPLIHPVAAAKMAATVDHISGGRLGLNLVMGWFTEEMAMFGATQREHDSRYRFGTEWLAIVNRLWSESEPFDFDGEFFQLREVQSLPKPQSRPILINAGSSPAGLDFAAREVDFNFASVTSIDSAREFGARFRALAAERYERQAGVLTNAVIICRDSEREAERAYRAILDDGDWEGARNVMRVLGIESESFGEQIADFEAKFVVGFGAHAIRGTPEQVAEGLRALSDAGIDGVFFGLPDYASELRPLGEKVLPLLREMDLRI
ncbi:MAG: LLM class flavin-dependent oxidoreductase [Actinobacteria bacterium]|nr:LLM class flavin-dependent oxidoreductase [Actinomycetota bacterium]